MCNYLGSLLLSRLEEALLEERMVFECEIRSADILVVVKSNLLTGTKIKPISTIMEGIE